MQKIYLDQSSTSYPKAPGVGESMKQFMENGSFNVGRGAYESAFSVAEQIEDVREKLCRLFGSNRSRNVIFTPGVTYSMNSLINGLLNTGDHVISTSMEHNAVARPLEAIKKRGINVDYLMSDQMGRLDSQLLESHIRKNTKAVVMLHASNVSGTILPIQEIGMICRQHNIFLVVDAAQTAGIVNIDMKSMGINALAFAGHKGLLGPQGIGGFIVDDELAEIIEPTIFGGTGSASDSTEMPRFMPDKFEAGTLNLPGIIGLSAALDYINEFGMANIRKIATGLSFEFTKALQNMKGIKIIGSTDSEWTCPVVSLDFIERDNAEIAFKLDQNFGIMTRCGLHCAPLAHKTLGTFPAGTVRFSFGHMNTRTEIEQAIEAVDRLVK